MRHYITYYVMNETLYAESWLQINVFGKSYCFSKKTIKIDDRHTKMTEQ